MPLEPAQLQPTAPNFAQEINQTTPWDQVLINPCNGEPVLLTGTQTIHLHVTTTPSGATNYGFTLSQSMTGVGLVTGVKYNARTRLHEKGSSHDPFPIIAEVSVLTHVVATTRVPGFYFDYDVKITINANGTLTHEKTDLDEGCRAPASA